jgi:hypothetical protein
MSHLDRHVTRTATNTGGIGTGVAEFVVRTYVALKIILTMINVKTTKNNPLILGSRDWCTISWDDVSKPDVMLQVARGFLNFERWDFQDKTPAFC